MADDNKPEAQPVPNGQQQAMEQSRPVTPNESDDQKRSVEHKMSGKKGILLILVALGILVSGILITTGSGIHLGHLTVQLDLMRLVIAVTILIVTFVLAVMTYWCDQPCTPLWLTARSTSALDQIESRTLRLVLLGGGLLIVGTFVWAGTFLILKSDQSEVALPIVIIAGVVILLLVLGLLTFAFSVLRLSDNKEALGLPSGSVRAVIALMLLVIFAIVAIFLYSDISSNSKLQTLSVRPEQVGDVKKQVDYVLDVDEVGKDGTTKTGNKTVYYRSGSKAAEDLAKQLIVLLGTLVTAVSSFYFGSASVAAASKAPSSGGPNAKAAKPTNLNPGGGPQALTITGTNLGNVVSVKLTFEKEEPILADASTLAASETTVTCKITTPAKAKYGPWTLVVSDNANNDSRVPDGISIGTAEASVETFTPPKLNIAQTDQPLQIAGRNLGKISSVKLMMSGQPDITSSPQGFERSDNEVKCKITVPGDAQAGDRQLVLFEGATKVVTASTNIGIGQ